MPSDYQRWVIDLSAAEDALVPGMLLRLQRQLVFLTLGAAVELSPGRFRKISGVVLLTPVDKGRARSSWNVSVGEPDLGVPPIDFRDNYQPTTAEQAAVKLARLGRFNTVWVTSNLPYIKVLEYGGYPDPVQRGTWVKGEGFVVRSSAGFSIQAPAGMLRLTVRNIKAALGAA